MTYSSKPIEVWLDVSGFCLQTLDPVLDSLHSVWREFLNRRQQTRLVTRIHHDVATLHEVIDPRAVIHRIHPAPAVQKDDHGRDRRLRRVRLKNPVLLSTLAVAILRHARVRVLFSARARRRLRRRRHALRQKNRRREERQDYEKSYRAADSAAKNGWHPVISLNFFDAREYAKVNRISETTFRFEI